MKKNALLIPTLVVVALSAMDEKPHPRAAHADNEPPVVPAAEPPVKSGELTITSEPTKPHVELVPADTPQRDLDVEALLEHYDQPTIETDAIVDVL